MRKHVIPLRLLLNDRTDIYELLQRLGETKEHGRFVKSVPVQQLVGLIELLQRKQRGENIEVEIRKRREALAQKNGHPASGERQISAINEEDENSSLRNSMKSTSSQSNSKDKEKDEAQSPRKSPAKDASKRQKDEDLNKVTEEELQRKKAEMDVLFEKNAKRPGDPDFVYDKQIDFDGEAHDEPASWDEEGEDEDKDGTKDSSNSEIRTESSSAKNDTQTDGDQLDKTKESPSKAIANPQDDSDGDRSRSGSNKKDKDKDGDRYDAAFEFDDEDDFEFEAKSKPSSVSPSRIPVAKRQFAQSPKKSQDVDEDLPF